MWAVSPGKSPSMEKVELLNFTVPRQAESVSWHLTRYCFDMGGSLFWFVLRTMRGGLILAFFIIGRVVVFWFSVPYFPWNDKEIF